MFVPCDSLFDRNPNRPLCILIKGTHTERKGNAPKGPKSSLYVYTFLVLDYDLNIILMTLTLGYSGVTCL